MSKLEKNWSREEIDKMSRQEILEGEEEYRREEFGDKELGDKYWDDEGYENKHNRNYRSRGNSDSEDESAYEMHGVYFDKYMGRLEKYLLDGDFNSANKILKHYKKEDNIITVIKNVVVSYLFLSEGLYNSRISELTDFLRETRFPKLQSSSLADHMKDNYFFKKEEIDFSIDEFLNSPQIDELIIREIYDRWHDNDYYDNGDNEDEDEYTHIISIIENLNVSASKKEKIVLKIYEEQLILGNFDFSLKLKRSFPSYSREFNSPTMNDTALEGLFKALSDNSINKIVKIVHSSLMPPEKLNSQEVKSAAFESLKDSLSSGLVDIALEIRDIFIIPAKVMESDEIEEEAFNGLIATLSKAYRIDHALKIIDNFQFSRERLDSLEAKDAALEGVINCFDIRRVDQA